MKRMIILAAFACLSTSLLAQSINTTVDVSNDFTSSFSGISKKNLDMSIPDSLLQFNKDFEYFTFDNAYKGSYRFTPYSVEIRPDKGTYGTRSFYLNAGAGYQLRPVLQAVYSPVMKDSSAFGINIFQDGEGYMGNYVSLGSGYRFTEKLGADIVASLPKSIIRADLYFDGGMASVPSLDQNSKSNMYSGTVDFSAASSGVRKFDYRVDLHYNLARLEKTTAYSQSRTEHFISAKAAIEPALGKTFRLPIDVDFQYDGNFAMGLTPHFKLVAGIFTLNAGVRLDYLNYVSDEVTRTGLTVHPDVVISVKPLKKALDIYLCATGGRKIYGSQELYAYNPFLTYIQDAYSEESVNAFGGLRGHIANKFEYDVKVGDDVIASAPFNTLSSLDGYAISSVSQQKMNLFYVDARLGWRSESVDVDGTFRYNASDWRGSQVCLDLPRVKADLKAVYNWNRLLYVGASCAYASQRTSSYSSVPSYFDLGAFVEYHFTRQFSVWVKGVNLLGQQINVHPGYAEQGAGGLVGISLNL